MVEQPAVNRRVTGSSPVSGAIFPVQARKPEHSNLSPAPADWQALAEAAQTFLDVARRRLNQAPCPLAPSLSPSPRPSGGATLADLINDFLVAKTRAGRSMRYVRQLRVSLSSFAKGRLRTPAAGIIARDVEEWLAEKDWAPRTQKGYLGPVPIAGRP